MNAAPSRPAPADWAMLCTLGMIWGGSFTASEIALEGFSPFLLVGLRLTLAALILTPLAYALGAPLPGFSASQDRRVWAHIAGLALLSNALPFSLLTWAQQHVTAGYAGMSMAVMPLMVLPLSHVFVPGERLTKRRLTGFSAGFLGVAILVGGGALDSSGAGAEIWAQLACLLAALCYAGGSIVTRLSPPAPMAAFSAGSVLLGAAVLVPLSLALEDPGALSPGWGAWGAALYLGAVPTGAAALLLVTLVRRAGPPFLSLVNYMVPVWAACFGAVLLGEPLGWRFGLALALILAGAAWAQGASLPGLGRRRRGAGD